jgi:hypothetical protein
MIVGAGLFTGGLISSIIIPSIGFSVLPMIVAVIALIAGAVIAVPNFNEIRTVSQPPADVTEIPPSQQLDDQMKYVLNFALRMGGIAILVLVISIIL